MDVFGQLWPNEYPEGKTHLSVVNYLKVQVTAKTTMEHIYRLVVRWGVRDDMDALATSRALWAIRDSLRLYVRKPRISFK